MAERRDGDAAGEIEIALARGRHEMDALAPFEGDALACIGRKECAHQPPRPVGSIWVGASPRRRLRHPAAALFKTTGRFRCRTSEGEPGAPRKTTMPPFAGGREALCDTSASWGCQRGERPGRAAAASGKPAEKPLESRARVNRPVTVLPRTHPQGGSTESARLAPRSPLSVSSRPSSQGALRVCLRPVVLPSRPTEFPK